MKKSFETNKPVVLTTLAEVTKWRQELGSTSSVGFVPTMGALHEGHATLLRKIRSRSEVSVLSIFVNPTQFGPQEDLSRYPRTFESDLKTAAREGVDVVFAPSPSEIYPRGYTTFIEETEISQPLCGKFRPGHFRGVTTIVLKLFNLIRPQLALFGLKDAQQFFVLERMVRDLNLNLQIEGARTLREVDGLAMSSRNVYLSPEERMKAPLLYQNLLSIQSSLEKGMGFADSIQPARKRLEEQGFNIQYLECLELPSFLAPSTSNLDKPYLVAGAAYLGKTRLIDNIILKPEKLKDFGIQIEI